MVNWTTGTRNITHALELAEVQRILTASALVTRIESQGTDLGSLKSRFVLMEELRAKVSKTAKFLGVAAESGELGVARACSRTGDGGDPADQRLGVAAESRAADARQHPHQSPRRRRRGDPPRRRLHDRLPAAVPFFWLTVTLLAPLLADMRAVYHANPTQAWVLARLIEAYRATLLCGTPTFLSGIVHAASGGQLDSLRLAVTGAEKCPERTYAALAQSCPQALILEGYGITEVFADRLGRARAARPARQPSARCSRRWSMSSLTWTSGARSSRVRPACSWCAARASSAATSVARRPRRSSNSPARRGTARAIWSAPTRTVC